MRTHCVLRNIYLGTILDIFRTYYVEFVHKYDTNSTDLASLMFYGWAFVHRTSLCLRILENKVYSRNNKEHADFILAAWGRSGGSAEAESNAGTRRRRR